VRRWHAAYDRDRKTVRGLRAAMIAPRITPPACNRETALASLLPSQAWRLWNKNTALVSHAHQERTTHRAEAALVAGPCRTGPGQAWAPRQGPASEPRKYWRTVLCAVHERDRQGANEGEGVETHGVGRDAGNVRTLVEVGGAVQHILRISHGRLRTCSMTLGLIVH
jgi:hypothetical protein